MDRAVIVRIQSCGFDVYMRPGADTYLYFTDGTRIGYLQEERFGGYSLSTVHKPNSTSGTAFSIAQGIDVFDIDKQALERCFSLGPDWAHHHFASAKKWPDMATFLKANSFNASYELVPAEVA